MTRMDLPFRFRKCLDKEYKVLEEDDSVDKGSQRQGDLAVQRLRKQGTIPQLTAASHIFCLTEHNVGY